MNFKKRSTIIWLTVLAVLLLAPVVQVRANDYWPIVPCGLQAQPAGVTLKDANGQIHDYTQQCNQCLLILLFNNIINLTFFWIVPVVGTFFVLLGGFFILVGGGTGNQKWVGNGYAIFKSTLIGAAIILSSWVITNYILKTLSGNQNGVANGAASTTPWYQIQCTTNTLAQMVNGTVPNSSIPSNSTGIGTGNTSGVPVTTGATGGTTGGGTGTGTGGTGTGANTGPQCQDSSTNLCQGNAHTCSNNSCAQYDASIAKYANGAASANLLKAIMVQESSCNPTASNTGGNSYGLMELQQGTAVQYSQGCVPNSSVITNTWLTDPNNSDAIICIAANYINSLAAGTCGSNVENIAAGYNSGGGYCAPSTDCTTGQSCTDGGPVRAWECLYDKDSNGNLICNTGLEQTRGYAMNVLYCNNNPGF